MRLLWLVCLVILTSTASANPEPPPAEPPPAAPPAAAPPATDDDDPPPPPRGAPAPALAPPGLVPVLRPTVTGVYEVDTAESYRWQIIAADGVSFALLFSGNGSVAAGGGLGYLFGAPIIHGLHEQGGRAVASFLVRTTLPLLGGLAGAKLAESHSNCGGRPGELDDCDDEGGILLVLLGITTGALAAMTIDAAVIARPVIHKHVEMTWAPQLALTPGHVNLGVVGRF